MKECHIVVYNSYDEGCDSYAYYSFEEAVKTVKENVDIATKSLTDQGYDPIIHESDDRNCSVYVPDSDIYYDWSIITSYIM